MFFLETEPSHDFHSWFQLVEAGESHRWDLVIGVAAKPWHALGAPSHHLCASPFSGSLFRDPEVLMLTALSFLSPSPFFLSLAQPT